LIKLLKNTNKQVSLSPLCSIGPSFADHLGNNSEQPGSVLEAESMTLFSCSTSPAAQALRQSSA
jgi:hypothetical protein